MSNAKRTNSALWLGLILTALGLFSNWMYFLKFPASILPWINLILPIFGLLFLLAGVVRAFRPSQAYGGRIWGSIVTLVSALLVAGGVWLFVIARHIPRSAGAPQVGQRVPDFTLPDSEGEPVSLAQLLSGTAGIAPPKAVLLVFYRGYW
jgi:hypothetical protein